MTALLTFRADLDSGEGEIKSWPKFEKLSPLMKQDLLGDWLGQLNLMYESALNEMMNMSPEQFIKECPEDVKHLACSNYPNCDTEGCGEH